MQIILKVISLRVDFEQFFTKSHPNWFNQLTGLVVFC